MKNVMQVTFLGEDYHKVFSGFTKNQAKTLYGEKYGEKLDPAVQLSFIVKLWLIVEGSANSTRPQELILHCSVFY